MFVRRAEDFLVGKIFANHGASAALGGTDENGFGHLNFVFETDLAEAGRGGEKSGFRAQMQYGLCKSRQ